jgi:hypothetical protein
MAGSDEVPKEFLERVSQEQLQSIMSNARKDLNEVVTRVVTAAIHDLMLDSTIERLDKRLSTLTDRITALEEQPPFNKEVYEGSNHDDEVYDENGNVNQAATKENRLRRRLGTNTTGKGGGQRFNRQRGNRTHASNDPYAKVKFEIPSFSGHYDAKRYLDWEMIVEQKFSAHLVPDQHRVRQATCEYQDFAIVWWTGLIAENATPSIWEELKASMHDRFVPPSYHRDLHKKLMRLEQGDKSMQDNIQKSKDDIKENEVLTTSCENSESSPITLAANESKVNTHYAKLAEGESSLDMLNFSTNHAMIEQTLVEPSFVLPLS